MSFSDSFISSRKTTIRHRSFSESWDVPLVWSLPLRLLPGPGLSSTHTNRGAGTKFTMVSLEFRLSAYKKYKFVQRTRSRTNLFRHDISAVQWGSSQQSYHKL